jgi:hypothetical protein
MASDSLIMVSDLKLLCFVNRKNYLAGNSVAETTGENLYEKRDKKVQIMGFFITSVLCVYFKSGTLHGNYY